MPVCRVGTRSNEDCWWLGETAATQMMWDKSVDSLLLTGTAAKQRIGTFAGAASGSGSVLSASNTASFRVYTDDGGAAIGSGQFVRAGVFRNLQTYTSGNREQESGGVVGQVVSVSGTNRHNMAGTWGSYEARTALTVDGQAAATDTWIQAGVLGRVGSAASIITINTNAVLAGVAAMSNVNTGFAANTGIYSAFYAGAWASAVDWDYGVYIEAAKASRAWYSNTTLTGGSTTTRNVMDVQVTDETTNTGNYQRGVYVNWTATGDKTSGGEINCIATDLTLTGSNTPYAYGFVFYASASSDPTLGFVAPISIYVDNLGSACGALVGIDIGMATTDSPIGRHTYIRCRAHTGDRPRSVLLLEGAGSADYIFEVTHPSYAPFDAGTGASSNCAGHIAVYFVDTAATRYLRLYESTS